VAKIYCKTKYNGSEYKIIIEFVCIVLYCVQVSPSFAIKNKRMIKCHKRHTSISIRKSPKFSGCPGDGQGVRKLHKVIKTEGSYFQVISVDAFGSYCCKEWMN